MNGEKTSRRVMWAGYCQRCPVAKFGAFMGSAVPAVMTLLAGVRPTGVRPQCILPSGVGKVVRPALGPRVEGMGVATAGLDTWGIPKSSNALRTAASQPEILQEC